MTPNAAKNVGKLVGILNGTFFFLFQKILTDCCEAKLSQMSVTQTLHSSHIYLTEIIRKVQKVLLKISVTSHNTRNWKQYQRSISRRLNEGVGAYTYNGICFHSKKTISDWYTQSHQCTSQMA